MTTSETGPIVGRIAELHRFPVKSMLGESLAAADIGPAGLAGDRAYALVDVADGTVASAKRPRRWGRLLDVRATFVEEPVVAGPTPPVRLELPDGTAVTSDDPDVDDLLSAFVGRPVHLASSAPEGRSFDEVWPDIEGLAPPEFIEGTRLADAERAADEDPSESISRIGLGALAPAGTFFDLATLHLLTTGTLDALRAEAPEATFDVRRYRPNVLVATQEDGFVENGWVGATIGLGPTVLATGSLATMRCIMTTLAQDGLAADRGTLQAVARANRVEIPGLGRWACAGVYADVATPGRVQVGDEVRLG